MIDYKHSCVVNAQGHYKDIVLFWHREVYDTPPLGEDGLPDWSQATHHMEWVPESYTLEEDDQLIDTKQPTKRPHAGVSGLVRPRWDVDTSAWEEAATAAEIAAWEALHPAPELPGPTQQEQMRADIDFLAALGGVVL